MIRNYMKIAVRNLMRNKLFSGINILGLSLGTACFLIILAYVYSQFQYDRHHSAGDSLFRVETEMRYSDDNWISATVSPPIIPQMKIDFPEVIRASRVVDPPETSDHMLKWQDQIFYVEKGYYVDSLFFEMFDYDWVEGNAKDALKQPYSVVLTKKVKERLFGRDNAFGEVITINNRFGEDEFLVAGVVDASTNKSHIRPDFYMSMNSGGIGEYVINNTQWAGGNFIAGYVELHEHANAQDLESKLVAFMERYGGDQLREFGASKILTLQSVPDIHLYSKRENQLGATGNLSLIKILMLIAFFILIIACVNFMNLSTAKSIKRGTEVGVRKTLGAAKTGIIKQFYFETALIAGCSLAIAIIFTLSALPSLATLTGETFQFGHSKVLVIGLAIFGLYALTTLLAGSYPAFFLSSFKPIAAINNRVNQKFGQEFLRKLLVTIQFTVSMVLIISTLLIMNQLDFIKKKDLGFSSEGKIIVPFKTANSREFVSSIKNEVLREPQVNHAAGVRIFPSQFMAMDFNLYKEGENMMNSHNVHIIQGDEDYFKTLGVPILHGRAFNHADTIDQILINTAALQELDIDPEQAVGQKLYSQYNDEIDVYEIVGVVPDYHQTSLREELASMIFEYRPTNRNSALLINAPVVNNDLIQSLEKIWYSQVDDTPFEFQFLNESIQNQYESETKLSKAIAFFTLMAIFISCLGLFGLSVFTAEQRIKEIGIRKVLGASAIGIVNLLSKDLVKLVLLSAIFASPISFLFIKDWLNNFVYHAGIQYWVFVLATVIALLVALITISFQSLKAASANPVESLRNQ